MYGRLPSRRHRDEAEDRIHKKIVIDGWAIRGWLFSKLEKLDTQPIKSTDTRNGNKSIDTLDCYVRTFQLGAS